MSNRVIVKFSFIAAMFVFASCYSDVPSLPSPEEVREYKWCGYENELEKCFQCKSTYEVYKDDCKLVGTLFDTETECRRNAGKLCE